MIGSEWAGSGDMSNVTGERDGPSLMRKLNLFSASEELTKSSKLGRDGICPWC